MCEGVGSKVTLLLECLPVCCVPMWEPELEPLRKTEIGASFAPKGEAAAITVSLLLFFLFLLGLGALSALT